MPRGLRGGDSVRDVRKRSTGNIKLLLVVVRGSSQAAGTVHCLDLYSGDGRMEGATFPLLPSII